MLLGFKHLSPPPGIEVGYVSTQTNAKTDLGHNVYWHVCWCCIRKDLKTERERKGGNERGERPFPCLWFNKPFLAFSALLRFVNQLWNLAMQKCPLITHVSKGLLWNNLKCRILQKMYLLNSWLVITELWSQSEMKQTKFRNADIKTTRLERRKVYCHNQVIELQMLNCNLSKRENLVAWWD